jgi:hypothetical protein
MYWTIKSTWEVITMSIQIPVETAASHLKALLAELPLGETITLLDPAGQPLGLLVSLKSEAVIEPQKVANWRAEWESLAEKVSAAWKSDKSAIETLVETRRWTVP